ncbi:biliverdin-producing heme oxygenase [Corynebacterium sputi]|uniref:biliverdin-producing heme oxygenase n=1 Tax=Corynebacterium sputi TaxID=489915 RepID=UPI000425D4C7
MSNVPVHVRNLTVRIGNRSLLSSVSLSASPGRVTALVGPNGAGKSTLLKVIAGDIPAGGGEAVMGEENVGKLGARRLAELRAVLMQAQTASVPFTAGEVVDFGRAPHAQADPELRARIIRSCDIAHLLDRPVTVLSGGELSRVHLARVLLQDTPVLLLDEPTAALDLRHAEAVLRIAAERAAAGATVIVVLHDLSAAAAHADDVVVLERGEIVARGAPEQTLTADLVSRIYGTPVEILRDSAGNAVIVPAKARNYTNKNNMEGRDAMSPITQESATDTERPLSVILREATAVVHDEAENSGFMSRLLDGDLDSAAAADLAAQLWFIYVALENAVREVSEDPIAAGIYDPRLERVPALELDLAALLGENWRAQITADPSTAAYVRHLEGLAEKRDAAAVVAHHYVRYLGDISGGQVIGRRLSDHYGIDGDGARFYDFAAIGKIKPYRDAYRVQLDELPLTGESSRAALADESVTAFRLNTAVFRDLAAKHVK